MADAELAAWAEARAADGVPLPEPYAEDQHEAVTVEVDGVDVGGAVLAFGDEPDGRRCSVRVLQTTLPRDDTEVWTAVAGALGEHARARGATSLTTAVAPALTGAFGRAGFQATMIAGAGPLDRDNAPDLQVDRTVAVRPMDLEERRRFAVEAREVMVSGMELAGVVDPASRRLDELDARLARLAEDSAPEGELLLTATVADEPVGSAWATLVPRVDGLDYFGHTMFLYAEHRGRGLSKSFLGALVRNAEHLGVTDIHARVYGRDEWARQQFLRTTDGVEDVHVRKDLS
ncbi:GNAT family N-acetyltransferase [Nocardioides hankookensis]|uniref:GNAT family N-acetyltransferase n=1 Tax=Nocardioides hankookensis TaxID=443157 RepID=A0ABW1LHZ5_9ACTN